jgi:hypothetical protein
MAEIIKNARGSIVTVYTGTLLSNRAHSLARCWDKYWCWCQSPRYIDWLFRSDVQINCLDYRGTEGTWTLLNKGETSGKALDLDNCTPTVCFDWILLRLPFNTLVFSHGSRKPNGGRLRDAYCEHECRWSSFAIWCPTNPCMSCKLSVFVLS